MARRFIDISITLENGIKSDPDFMIPRIKYDTHEKTTSDICAFFPGLTKNELPEAQGWAVETITFQRTTARMSMHLGIIIRLWTVVRVPSLSTRCP